MLYLKRVAFALWLIFVLAPTESRSGPIVKYALVLGFDKTGSMFNKNATDGFKGSHFEKQITGTVQALSLLAEEIASQPIFISAVAWAGGINERKIVMPWTLIQTPDDVRRFAVGIQSVYISFGLTSTEHAEAIAFGLQMLDSPLVRDVPKRIIDISTDGWADDSDGHLSTEREFAEAAHVQVNAIDASDGDVLGLADNLRALVVTKTGFVEEAGPGAYVQALTEKLKLELNLSMK